MSEPRKEISPGDQLRSLSLADLKALRKRSARTPRASAPPLNRQVEKAEVPLSFAQERLWFLEKLGLVGSAYNIPMALRLIGSLDISALQRAFDELVRRHEALRTRIEDVSGIPIQIIDSPGKARFAFIDLSKGDANDREEELQQLCGAEVSRHFDLAKESLLRISLIRLSSDEHALVITVHHIVYDGWSSGVLLRELGVLYDTYVRGHSSELAEPPIQYSDFGIWQRQWLQGAALDSQLKYWKQQLSGAAPTLNLPADHPRHGMESFRGAQLSFSVEPGMLQDLKALSRVTGTTLFMVMLAAYQLFLSRWSGQADVIVGTPFAGRGKKELENVIGVFVNTLPLRMVVSEELTFVELLQKVKDMTLDAHAHQDVPFDLLLRELHVERSLSRQPIFQALFVLQNFEREPLRMFGMTTKSIPLVGKTSNFDLSLYLREEEGAMHGKFEFSTDLFESPTIGRIAENFQDLLRSISKNFKLPMHQWPLASELDTRLLARCNATEEGYPENKLLHELFEEQVRRSPDAVALVFEEVSLSYRELDRRANKLGRALRKLGAGPDKMVAACLHRGPNLVLGLLGILKSEAAYIPLDPGYPSERLAYMIDDAAPRVILTERDLRAILPSAASCVIEIDEQWRRIAVEDDGELNVRGSEMSPHHLAYVIYTSGSTGAPKGVMVEHTQVINFLNSMQLSPGIAASDRLLAVTTASFDIAGLEIYLPLVSGATVVLAGREIALDAIQLGKRLDEADCTVLQATPAAWQVLLNGEWVGRPGRLKALCGGEALPTRLSSQLIQKASSLWNLYGPTETTIWSCRHPIEFAEEGEASESIGRPIGNTQIHILDSYRRRVPIGAIGEIFIGGAGVSRGYLNRPVLTAERFIADPFCSDSIGRLYGTGDLGRWRSDGTIEYLGRNDLQVKIRGFRIELGEIEAQMTRYPGISKSVVVVREAAAGEKQVLAYFTSVGATVPEVGAIRDHLSQGLPDYMIPNAFIHMNSFPLTPSGKVDRQALPKPNSNAYLRRQFEPPQGAIEEALARIWEGLLSIRQVGRSDNFFELGGHSLLGVQLVARIEESLSVRLPVAAVFLHPTVRQMAQAVTLEGRPTGTASSQGDIDEVEI